MVSHISEIPFRPLAPNAKMKTLAKESNTTNRHAFLAFFLFSTMMTYAHPAFAFWNEIFGYDSYEECVLDKMQGTTGDLAAKQIVRACRELTKGDKASAPITPTPSKIIRVYIDIISSEWIDNHIFGDGTTLRVLVKNDSKYTLQNIGMWAKMEPCDSSSRLNRMAQQKLQEMGYKIAVDGQFGKASQTALREFQKEKGLSETGDLDSATLKALALEDASDVFPPFGTGILMGTYRLNPNESAHVDFINFYAQSRGREFCFRLGADIKVPLD
jgi:hypothetical protein